MSEKRFSLTNPISHNPIPKWVMIVHDDVEHKHLNAEELVDLLNSLNDENEQLRQKLECCEYEHFKKELDKIHEKVEKGDLSDFCTLTISDKGLEHWNGVLK